VVARAEQREVGVFLSYRRVDNPAQGPYPGKVTVFRDDLQAAISQEVGHRWTRVFMDTDPETMIGERHWRDKILRELERTTVLVSIMTANYVDPEDNPACLWELMEYYRLYQADPAHHSLITVSLCDHDYAKGVASAEVWEALSSQEVISYRECRQAWNDGQGHGSWGNLVGRVAEAILGFAKGVPGASGGSASPRLPVVEVAQEEQLPESTEHVVENQAGRHGNAEDLPRRSAQLAIRTLNFIDMEELREIVEELRGLVGAHDDREVAAALALSLGVERHGVR
jgi:hypothetical protein